MAFDGSAGRWRRFTLNDDLSVNSYADANSLRPRVYIYVAAVQNYVLL